MAGEIMTLITRYLEAVDRAVGQLILACADEDPLAAAHSGRIPRSGSIRGLTYSFHGVGCKVDFGGWCVDFDFGPAGRHDGFEAWRLWQFARQFASKFPEFQDLESTKKALDDLRVQGIVTSPRWAPSAHLLYLAHPPAC